MELLMWNIEYTASNFFFNRLEIWLWLFIMTDYQPVYFVQRYVTLAQRWMNITPVQDPSWEVMSRGLWNLRVFFNCPLLPWQRWVSSALPICVVILPSRRRPKLQEQVTVMGISNKQALCLITITKASIATVLSHYYFSSLENISCSLSFCY